MAENKLKIGVIVASTRDGRYGAQVADWVKKTTDKDSDIEYTYLDLKEIDLPFYRDAKLPLQGDYTLDSTKGWAKQIDAQDGFLVLVPEYNHGYPASLKNALDTLYAEWNRKPAAYVGYGVVGAARSIEQLNNIFLNLEVYPIANKTTNISLFEHLNEVGELVPHDRHQDSLDGTLAALKEWTSLFKTLREA